MRGSYTVHCEGPGGTSSDFTGLCWESALRTYEGERLRPWHSVTLRCEGTGAAVFRGEGAASRIKAGTKR